MNELSVSLLNTYFFSVIHGYIILHSQEVSLIVSFQHPQICILF